MVPTTLWPVVGSLAAAGGTLALVWTLRDRRGRPGATWLLAVLGVQFVLTLSYGVGLLVFEPTVRLVIEMLFWISYIWLGALFVAFGLAYTGRGHVIESPWFGVLAALSLALSALVVTNPLHHLVWADFAVTPTGGLATVSFTRRGGALLVLGVSALGAAVGTLLLVDTIISYGKLYRAEALAVAISPLPPGIGLILWTFDIAPIPGLNVAPMLFLLHVGFDAYAFVGSEMFEFHPATRRAGNRAAIADLGNPVVIVDEQSRVVTLNPAAEETFDLTTQSVLARPFGTCYEGDDIDPTTGAQDTTLRTSAGRRVFKVTSTALSDSTGTHLGYSLVFQDITAERQREQRLAVLNRILRHNLRNDLTVVRMNVDEAAARGDDAVAEVLEPAERKVDGLVDLSQKARAFEQVIEDSKETVVAVPDVVGAVVAQFREQSDATIEIEGADDALLRTNAAMLEIVVENLVENAVEHGSTNSRSQAHENVVEHGHTDGETLSTTKHPNVRVTVSADEDTVTVTVRDWGPGIPQHELAVIEDGDESALEHGSGLGLWLVTWGVTALGGDISFDTDDGTAATVRLPVVDVPADRASPDETV